MLVSDYTTYDEVRAALGVSEDDIEDGNLDLPLYADNLQVELEDVNVGIPALYDSLKSQSTLSADQQRFVQAAHLFATYAVAKQLTVSLPMFGPEQITDGKAAIRRFSQDDPIQKVINAVNSQYGRFRARLEQLFSVVNSSTSQGATPKLYFGVVSPSSDPITGT